MPISKPTVIATAGPTVDGRNISPEWIQQMAASYDPKVFTAVVNLEHYISPLPDSVFSAYGKVVSLGTQEAEILGEKKLQLTAVVDVPDAVVAMQKSGKKAFSSMEVQPNFIGKGFSYLTGLALTDSPASLGTEPMKFSAFKSEKDNVFAFAAELGLEFEDGKPADENKGESLFAKVKELLGFSKKDTDARFSDTAQAVEAIAQSQKEALDSLDKFSKDFAGIQGELKKLTADQATAAQEFAAFKSKLDQEEAGGQKRPQASGGDGAIKTDC